MKKIIVIVLSLMLFIGGQGYAKGVSQDYVELELEKDMSYLNFDFDYNYTEYKGYDVKGGFIGKWTKENSTLPRTGYLDVLHFLSYGKSDKMELRAGYMFSHEDNDYGTLGVKIGNGKYYINQEVLKNEKK